MERAHARATDPQTSHEAADAATLSLPENQAIVEAFALRIGAAGFTDKDMTDALEDSTSTLRTRRAELTARNIILDSGQRRTSGESPRQRIVWVHRSYVLPEPPPILPPPESPVEREELRTEAKAQAGKLEGLAKSFRGQGLAMVAHELERSAELLRLLAR